MNAFISYSISDNEQYILSLLAQKVAETGLTLVTSYNQSDIVDVQTINDIKNSAVFVGLITLSGHLPKTNRVYLEFKQANLYGRPAIFLIEDRVKVHPWVDAYQNTVRFNRYRIYEAIQEVNNKINSSKMSQSNSNAAAWILGGIAVLGLLSLLSDEQK